MTQKFEKNGITIFIDEKSIKQRHREDAIIVVDQNEKDITLPYYVNGGLDWDGELTTFTLMSSGNRTLRSLQAQAFTETLLLKK